MLLVRASTDARLPRRNVRRRNGRHLRELRRRARAVLRSSPRGKLGRVIVAGGHRSPRGFSFRLQATHCRFSLKRYRDGPANQTRDSPKKTDFYTLSNSAVCGRDGGWWNPPRAIPHCGSAFMALKNDRKSGGAFATATLPSHTAGRERVHQLWAGLSRWLMSYGPCLSPPRRRRERSRS